MIFSGSNHIITGSILLNGTMTTTSDVTVGNYLKSVAYYGVGGGGPSAFIYANGATGDVNLIPGATGPRHVYVGTGSLRVTSGNIIATGSANISQLLTLQPLATLPTVSGPSVLLATGSLAVSGSGLYFYNGAWTKII